MKKIVTLSLLAFLICSSVFASSGSIPKPGTIPTTPTTVDTTKKPIKWLVILGDNYAVDNERVYVVNETRSAWVQIPADRASFRVILGQFARDKNAIYQMGRVIPGADLASFSAISGQHGYAQDDNHIYGPHGVIPEADPETFKMLTKNYSLDAGHVFFDGKLIDADSGSFEVIDNGLYAVDDERVFYAGKILGDTSPDGFIVKGPRAFAADGRTFFEWLIERGDLPLPEPEQPAEPVEPTPEIDTETPTAAWASFWEKISQYQTYFTGENTLFWLLVGLSMLGIFSILFLFFADRNDEPVSLWKSIMKTAIAVAVTLVAVWLASLFLAPLPALIIGSIIGIFFFITLWSALGWIKSFLITLLTLIGIVFFSAVAVLIARAIFGDVTSVLEFVTRPQIQLMGIMKIIGFFVGAWLIMTQLGSSLVRSLGQAFVATAIALMILGLLLWITGIGTLTSLVIFSLLYAVLLWIMRFRIVSNLFVETVRIVRIVIILAVVIGLVVWIVL